MRAASGVGLGEYGDVTALANTVAAASVHVLAAPMSVACSALHACLPCCCWCPSCCTTTHTARMQPPYIRAQSNSRNLSDFCIDECAMGGPKPKSRLARLRKPTLCSPNLVNCL